MPVVFCVLGYLLLLVALRPVWSMASAAVGFLVAEEAPNFDSNLTSVYEPDALKATVQDDNYILGTDISYPSAAEQYGQISCARIGLDAPVYMYDTDEILLYGVGQALVSMPPGYGTAIVLSAHNTTYFKCLQDIAVGDVISFGTNWCDYEYTVTKVEVYNEVELEDLLAEKIVDEEHEELIMYTCYPFYAISGRKTDRLTVFADRTAGIDVRWKGVD